MGDALEKYRKSHFLGAGWSFPVSFSLGNKELDTAEYETNINESIRMVLSTKMYSRPLQPTFGSGLNQFFFQKMDESLKGQMQDAVRSALLHNEPRITVLTIEVEFAAIADGYVSILINYVFNQTNTRHNLVYPFYINEGTNLRTNK